MSYCWPSIVPVAQPDALFAFHELSRRQGDFAMSGVAARARRAGERWNTDWVAFGVSDRPVQLSNIKGLFDDDRRGTGRA